jgi:hypothetical protein
MPLISAKNQPLLPSANDLSFGGEQLSQQLSDAEEEARRRKMLGLGDRANPVLSPATLSLFSGFSSRS